MRIIDEQKLSVFVRQQGTDCDFNSSDAWVILSPIEQSIKRKIEAVGTPLKDWDINIYRGVLTGYNDAFIISTEKRNEILENCQTDDERTRTEALIRPILRGRDIKRYSYDWAGLWLIATFPSRHYNIEEYPAVKKHLLSFGKERLEQTGKTYTINGEAIKSRKKTNNKWFEVQDSISYWEDFNKPKIVWAETMRIRSTSNERFPRFAFSDKAFYTDKTCFIATGGKLRAILAVLNSPVCRWQLRQRVAMMDEGGYLMQKIYIEQILICTLTSSEVKRLECLVSSISSAGDQNTIEDCEAELDAFVYDRYQLSVTEREHLEKEMYSRYLHQ